MDSNLQKIIKGYEKFRKKYAYSNKSIMYNLYQNGQKPKIMIIACCDSRVDPGLILQCDPGELFVIRNVANIIPPYEKDSRHHGTSAALEFGICFLNIKHLIVLGHSQCGGIKALLTKEKLEQDDFITNWVSLVQTPNFRNYKTDDYSKLSLTQSYKNCLTFPWIKDRIIKKKLFIHLWFFDIKTGLIFNYINEKKKYKILRI